MRNPVIHIYVDTSQGIMMQFEDGTRRLVTERERQVMIDALNGKTAVSISPSPIRG